MSKTIRGLLAHRGATRRKKEITMKTSRTLLLFPVIAMMLSLATTASATTLASESKKGVAEAYAAIDNFNCTIVAFGGKRATGASASACAAGSGTVTFTGNFPTDITASKVIVNTTAQSSSFDVTNAIVMSATPTTIVVDVSDWESDNLTALFNIDWVTVFVGH